MKLAKVNSRKADRAPNAFTESLCSAFAHLADRCPTSEITVILESKAKNGNETIAEFQANKRKKLTRESKAGKGSCGGMKNTTKSQVAKGYFGHMKNTAEVQAAKGSRGSRKTAAET